ncbi:MAG TPA: iron-containing alcohol dehydrogenase, partial [bacterium]|nr:iron-containing alcohol dehydrogenase [bacterium]
QATMLSGTLLQEWIIYGKPAAEAVAAEVEALGASRVLLTSTRSLSGPGGLPETIARALGPRHAGTYSGVTAHSPRECVLAGAAQARAAQADLLVAVGGGSVIDATKVMLLCLWQNLQTVEALDPFSGRGRPGDPSRRPPGMESAVRMLAVPTTFSAAEFTPNAGVTDSRRKVKDGFSHPLFVPQVVVLDPAATLSTPLGLLLSTGMKAVDHAVERLCSPQTSPYSDATGSQALTLLARALPAIKARPQDLEARLEGQLGMWLSIIGGAAGTGVGASHALGHTLGGSYGVPHGITSCVTLPAVLRWNAAVNAERQQHLLPLLGGRGSASHRVAALVRSLGLPGRLRDVGIRRADLPAIAEHTMGDPPVRNNPRPIAGPAELLEILKLAW